MGRPTGKTRVEAETSRDRHVAEADERARAVPLAAGFDSDATVGALATWWLDHVARHRVRVGTLATYRKQLRVVTDALGSVPVRRLRPEQVTTFVSALSDAGSATRAGNVRSLLSQVLDQAVALGLADANVAKQVQPPRVPRVQRRTLTPDEVGRLVSACDARYAAAVAFCYVQGWRVSEALGLAWQDIDLDAGTVMLRRGATYVDRVGMMLGPTKTPGTVGHQLLGPTVLGLLRRWRGTQDAERVVVGDAWPAVVYDSEPLDLVFTGPAGRVMLRQYVDKAIRAAAVKAGLDPTGLGTHAGRRSVVTNLYASGSLDLDDVARFVGHSDTTTTRGYVQHEGDRPRRVSETAIRLLDPAARTDHNDDADRRDTARARDWRSKRS